MDGVLIGCILEHGQNKRRGRLGVSTNWSFSPLYVLRGVIILSLDSTTNTHPIPDNLGRWGKRMMSVCPFVWRLQNTRIYYELLHCIPHQGQIHTHGTIAQCPIIIQNKLPNLEGFFEILVFNIPGRTIPPNVLVTQARPDLVLLNIHQKIISLLQLTCRFERNTEAANMKKSLR